MQSAELRHAYRGQFLSWPQAGGLERKEPAVVNTAAAKTISTNFMNSSENDGRADRSAEVASPVSVGGV